MVLVVVPRGGEMWGGGAFELVKHHDRPVLIIKVEVLHVKVRFQMQQFQIYVTLVYSKKWCIL